ncbi:MAG: hypothetical protein EHM28_01070 [Spirochaetaceae bacterium]|nr:MAG: hypothetical protein EHM28_01070 [Spirochaetaceae bacterium]
MSKKAFPHIFSFILPLLGVLAMLFLFPENTLPEPVLELISTIDIPENEYSADSQTGQTEPADALVPFFLEEETGGVFGYLNRNNRLVRSGRAVFGCTISGTGYIVFPKVPDSLAINNPDGSPAATISGTGYPRYFAAGKRLFVFTSDLTGLREINSAGITIWRRNIPSWITSVSANQEIVVVGLSSGACLLLGKNGEIIREMAAGESRIACIYGTSCEQIGTRYAVLSGAGPHRIAVMEASTGELVFKTELPDLARTEKRMLFSSCRRYLFVEGDDSVFIIDLAEKKVDTIFLPGRLIAFSYSKDSGILVLLARRGENLELSGLRPPRALVFRTAYPSVSRFLYTDAGLIAAGRNNQISFFNTGEE